MASTFYLASQNCWRVTWKPLEGGSRKAREFRTEQAARAFAEAVPNRSRPKRSLAQRLEFGSTTTPSGCRIWTRRVMNRGYGHLTIGGRQILAHRASYELHVGPIPEGMVIDHLCRNRLCINPAHLEPVIQRENVLRSPVAPGAINARKTHCAQGHPYSEENTYVYDMRPTRSTTTRICKTCRSEWSRTSRARKAAREQVTA